MKHSERIQTTLVHLALILGALFVCTAMASPVEQPSHGGCETDLECELMFEQ